jgi:uncharacterized YigZ family protein
MQTIEEVGVAEQTINKSKFLAWVANCQSEQAVGAFLRAIATKNQNAHHLAYAFRIKTPDGIVPRFSDAGEPSGTAGMPLLQIIEGRDLINVCIAVIRYYGGVNLGKGGLVRAYGGTGKLAIETTNIVPYVEMQELMLTIDYKRVDELTKIVSKLNGKIIDKSFAESVSIKVRLPALEKQTLIDRFQTNYGQ